ncbi:MAG: hypothetical protein ACRC0R_04490 [Cetobacterium sp.]
MLKFQKIIEKCLEQFIIRKNLKEVTEYKIEYEFIRSILINGDTTFSRYASTLKESLSLEEVIVFQKEILKKTEEIRNKDIDKDDILFLLKKIGVNSQEKRNNYISQIKELGDLFIKMTDGDKDNYNLFYDKYQEYAFPKTNKAYFTKNVPLGLIVYLFELTDNFKELKIKYPLISTMNKTYSKYLITDFQQDIGVELGLRRKKNALDLLEDAKIMVKDISDENTDQSDDNLTGENELEKLRFERDNFKSSLLFIQNNFNELKEKIEEEALEAKKMSIGEFFVTLNSEKYGKFLDKVPYTEELLTKVRKEKLDKDIPPEIRTVIMFIKQVIKFIKDSGIEPTEEYSRVFNGTADDVAHMNYNGEPFFSHDEVKKLKIEAPGYKYKDITISIPTVSEVKCHE